MPTHETTDSVLFTPLTEAKHSLIWCHGLGADGHDFVPLAEELNLPDSHATRFIFPHAPLMPVTINQGFVMRAWFDIVGVRIDSKVDEVGINKSKLRVCQLIAHEMAQGIPPEHIFVGGFSQGAVMALVTGLTYPKKLGGIIALSGFLPHTETFLTNASDANRHTRLFVAHGSSDAIVPHALGLATKTALLNAGYPVTWKDYTMGHSVCPDEINDLRAWLLTENEFESNRG